MDNTAYGYTTYIYVYTIRRKLHWNISAFSFLGPFHIFDYVGHPISSATSLIYRNLLDIKF